MQEQLLEQQQIRETVIVTGTGPGKETGTEPGLETKIETKSFFLLKFLYIPSHILCAIKKLIFLILNYKTRFSNSSSYVQANKIL